MPTRPTASVPTSMPRTFWSSREGTSFKANTPAGSRKINIPSWAGIRFSGAGRDRRRAALGLTLDTIAARLAEMPRVPGRLYPLPGRRGSLLLDDSYSASPAAVQPPAETLAVLDAHHGMQVLGDMLELAEIMK